MVGLRSIPPWLDALLSHKFFDPCFVHSDPSDKKSERNLYCFDCCTSLCPKCLFRHRKHVLLQAYISNSVKVVFLKQRPVTRLFKNPGNSCFTCNRNLQEPFLFCCLSCKVEHVIATQGSLRIKVSDHRMLGFSDIDEFQEVGTDSAGSIPTSSGSTSSSDLRTALISTATTDIVRKKRSNLSLTARTGSNRPTSESPDHHHHSNSLNRRKKGVPNRSPLC